MSILQLLTLIASLVTFAASTEHTCDCATRQALETIFICDLAVVGAHKISNKVHVFFVSRSSDLTLQQLCQSLATIPEVSRS